MNHLARFSSLLLCLGMLCCGMLLPPIAQAAEPLASAGSNWDHIEVHLMSVTRKGSVMTVKWAAENTGDSKRRVEFAFTGKDRCYAIDEENGTKYYALTDEEGNAIASGNKYIGAGTNGAVMDVNPGSTKLFWMKMPAPPPEVGEIGIFLSETEPFDGIAIVDK